MTEDELEQITASLRSSFAAEAQEHAQRLLLMVHNGLSEDDVQRMLRGNILQSIDSPLRCQVKDTIPQRALGEALTPTPWPPTRMRCPLQERADAGEAVPCGALEPKRLPLLLENPRRSDDFIPCHDLHGATYGARDAVLGFDVESAQPLIPSERLISAAALLPVAKPSASEAEDLRTQLRFLVASGRLGREDLDDLTGRSLLMTQPQWLPCRDDSARTKYWHGWDAPDDDEDTESWERRCPLQVRALLGDRTVPCAEALRPQPAALVEEARRHYPARASSERDMDDGRPELPRLEDLPRSFQGDHDQPGEALDPVRRLGLHPCVMLGRLYALTFYPVMIEQAKEWAFAEDEDEDDWEEDEDEEDEDEEDEEAAYFDGGPV